MKIKKALISVSDKTNLISLVNKLKDYKIEILSTGGTAKFISDNGIEINDVSSYTQFPEIMDGRVKTLHPLIHGGILAVRGNKLHEKAMIENNIEGIDLVIINLYPFESEIKNNSPFEKCIENIDIGGPAMIRSAAKNYKFVTILVNPNDYNSFIYEIDNNNGATTESFRLNLAKKAFKRTMEYDYTISNWLSNDSKEEFPKEVRFKAHRKKILRYGENPHQKAAVYNFLEDSLANAKQIQGKDLSYNNLNDAAAALELAKDLKQFNKKGVVIVKHANPCGVAISNSLIESYTNALACDPTSAFGGIIATNCIIDCKTAKKICEIFTELIIAPEIDDDAKTLFRSKKNIRVIESKSIFEKNYNDKQIKSIPGGYLLQTPDNLNINKDNLNVVTTKSPLTVEIEDLLFSFIVAKHVKSNAIVFSKNGMTIGIGAGQMSRVDSSQLASNKARKNLSIDRLPENTVAASDAFFPFADGVNNLINAGVSSIIQPGGSVNDDQVIDAANKAGVSMVFTGKRHFKH
ncbi:bifunctional phosphoribosylaminoimidazolecarboxamide formyltransferase/IMP cyclohydrolase [Alphaproteobacteria bacterium]|nr:bifunctional phosphoribosylaminoimidazolecarboxamide formyltransferase/IMP cyclohydrolase [Alphaproteobacteria bacterium]